MAVQAEGVTVRVEGGRWLSLGLFLPVDCWQVADIDSSPQNFHSEKLFDLYPNLYPSNQKRSREGKFWANTAIWLYS